MFVGERVRCAWCFAAQCSANFCIFLRRLAKPVRRKITKGIYKDKDTKTLSHVACMNSAFGCKPKPDFIYLKRCASFVGKACYVHSLALSASHNCFYQNSSQEDVDETSLLCLHARVNRRFVWQNQGGPPRKHRTRRSTM